MRMGHFEIYILKIIKSTAVEQAIACAPVTQRARVRSPFGRFPVRGFYGIFPHL